MELLKRCVLLMATVTVVRCGPQGPQNQYLPPNPNTGYNYDRPSIPFPPPPRPPQQPPAPPPRPLPPAPQPPAPLPPAPQPPAPQPPSYPSPGPGYPTGPARPAPPPSYPSPAPQPPSYPSPGPGYPTGPARPAPPQEDHHHDHVHMPGMPYDFNYAVKDDYHGNDFSRNEVSDGDVVTGEYRVQLPDGRLQIVRYTADWATGFHADVTYEGEAQYPPPSEYKRPQVFPPQPPGQQPPAQQPPAQQPPAQDGYQYNAPSGGAAAF